jgi:ABC-type sugar transport system, periplasmic component
MGKKKIISVVLLVILLVSLLVGCQAADSGAAKEDDGKITLGFILLYRRDQFYMDLEQAAIAAAEERGIEIIMMDADYVNETEIAQIEAFVSQKVDAIALAPTDTNAPLGAIQAANEAGIPVFVYDTGLDDFTYVETWVGFDAYQSGVDLGTQAAAFINDNYAGTGKVAIVDHPQNPFVLGKRVEGFKDALAELCPGAEIVLQQDGEVKRELAMSIAENVLTAHPDTAVWFGANPDMAYGIIAALESKGIDPEKVAVYGEGWGEETLQWMLGDKPYLKGVLVTPPDKQAAYTIYAVDDYFKGKTIEKETLIPTDIITKENAAEYFEQYGFVYQP